MILTKNIEMAKVSSKYHIVHRVLKNQSSMPGLQLTIVVYSVVSRATWQYIVYYTIYCHVALLTTPACHYTMYNGMLL
jgi:hypothetical protein